MQNKPSVNIWKQGQACAILARTRLESVKKAAILMASTSETPASLRLNTELSLCKAAVKAATQSVDVDHLGLTGGVTGKVLLRVDAAVTAVSEAAASALAVREKDTDPADMAAALWQ